MRSSQQHLNQIRKWLRKQQLDQIRLKARTFMLEDWNKIEGHVQLPMDIESYSNTTSTLDKEKFYFQRQFMLQCEQERNKIEQQIQWDQHAINELFKMLVISEEKQEYPQTLVILRRCLDLLKPLSEAHKRHLSQECMYILESNCFKIISKCFKTINLNDESQIKFKEELRYVISSINQVLHWLQLKFWQRQMKTPELNFFLTLVPQKLSIFMYYDCLKGSQLMAKSLVIATDAINREDLESQSLMRCLEIINSAAKENIILIFQMNRDLLWGCLDRAFYTLNLSGDKYWIWNLCLLLEITEKVVELCLEEIKQEQLVFMKQIIEYGISFQLQKESRSFLRITRASTLKLILNYLHIFSNLIPEGLLIQQKWIYYCQAIVYESMQNKDMKIYAQIAGVILKQMGNEGHQKLQQLKKYASFQHKEPWLEQILYE